MEYVLKECIVISTFINGLCCDRDWTMASWTIVAAISGKILARVDGHFRTSVYRILTSVVSLVVAGLASFFRLKKSG